MQYVYDIIMSDYCYWKAITKLWILDILVCSDYYLIILSYVFDEK